MKILRAIAVAAPVWLAGCASYNMTKPAPAMPGPIAVTVSAQGASGWNDLPIGAYRVPDSGVIIAGHQTGGGIGIMFGLLGVLTEDAIETHKGANAIKPAEATLHIDLAAQTTALTQKAVASGRFGQTFAAQPAPGGTTLTVVPYTVITFVSDDTVRPYVVLKATLTPARKSDGRWSTRYIASSGAPMALGGDDGLASDGGVRLKTMLDQNLDAAVNVMLQDIASPHPRDPAQMYYAETAVPFSRKRVGVHAYQLSEDGNTVVFVPKVADAIVFAGVEVMDKSAVTLRPATADDKDKLLDDASK